MSSSFGSRQSLQGQANCVSAVYTSIGFESGRVIFVKICSWLAPSMVAASWMV